MLNQLKSCHLFKQLAPETLSALWSQVRYRTGVFRKREYIASGEKGGEVGIVVKGLVEVQKNLATGKRIILSQLKAGDMFGMVALFSHAEPGMTSLLAKTETKVIFITEEELLRLLMTDRQILKNYLHYINQRICLLNRRMECLAHEPINERVSQYYDKTNLSAQNNTADYVKLTKSELADYLGISRPSLYRALKDMKK